MESANPQPVSEQPQQFVSHENHSPSPSKTFLILIAIIILAGVGISAYFLGLKIPQPGFQSTTMPTTISRITSIPTPVVFTDALTLDVPKLEPNFDWQIASGYTTSSLDQYSLSYSNYSTEKDPKKWTTNYIPLTGKVWVTSLKNLTYDQYTKVDGQILGDYGNQVFDKIGWKEQVSIPNYQLQALEAGGPNGDDFGFIGIKDKNIRVFEFSTRTGCVRPGITATLTPCQSFTYELTIFESDITPLSTILAYINSKTVDTSSWKTYTDPTYHFSLRYPNNWFVYQNTTPSRWIELSEIPYSQIQPGRVNPQTGKSVTSLMIVANNVGNEPKEWPYDNGDSNPNPTLHDFLVNGYSAWRAQNRQGDDHVAIINPLGGYVDLDFNYYQSSSAFVESPVFNQILSTFKFTN